MLAFPDAHGEGRRAQRRLPPPLRPRRAVRADGLVPAVRHHPRRRAHVRAVAAPRHHLRAVHAGPAVGAQGGDGRRRARGVLRAHADRAHGDGVERRAGAHPVERGVRRARQCAGRISSRRSSPPGSPACSPASRSPTAPTWCSPSAWCSAGWCGRGATCGPPVLVGIVVGLVPMAVHLAIAGPGPAWTGHVRRPGRPPAGRARAAPPAVVVAPRRRAAGDRRDRAAVVAVPPPRRLERPVPVVPRDARRHRRLPRVRRVAAPLAIARRAPPPCSWWRSCRLGILPQALQRPDSTHLTWVTCVSWPFAVVVVAEVVRFVRPQARPQRGLALGAAVAVVLTFTFTSLFTFRYYLLHTRVSLGRVPHAFEVSRGDRHFYFGSGRAALAVAGRHRRSRPAGRARRPPVRRAAGPAPHLVQRHDVLLDVPGDDPGDVLHGDGSRPRQRPRLAPRRRPAVGRLRHPHVVLGRLARTEQRRWTSGPTCPTRSSPATSASGTATRRASSASTTAAGEASSGVHSSRTRFRQASACTIWRVDPRRSDRRASASARHAPPQRAPGGGAAR